VLPAWCAVKMRRAVALQLVLFLLALWQGSKATSSQAHRQKRQFNFNFGSLFGRRPTNNNNNGDQSQKRINLGSIAGQFLGQLANNQPKQGSNQNNQLNGLLNGIGQALNKSDITVGIKDGSLQVSVLPTEQSQNTNGNGEQTTKECKTVSGADPGQKCALPFTYKGIKYTTSCTLVDADDGKAWCSTLTDSSGDHVGGKGKWGHCSDNCVPNSKTGDETTLVVEGGDINSSGLSQLPWFPTDGKLSIPGQTDKRFLSLGLNQPNNAYGTCRSSIAGTGSCRHLHHCLKKEFFNFFTFISNVCIINGRYIGVCCPDGSSPLISTSTTRPTDSTTQSTSTTTSTTTTTTRPTAAPTTTKSTINKRNCGRNKKRFQTRIVGGRPADPDEWPWLAALIHTGGRGSGQYCGATLISDTHVLTAAHCMEPFRREDVRVKLGEYNFNLVGETEDQIFSLDDVRMHEKYNNVTYENDIAVLKLSSSVKRTRSINAICLPDESRDFTGSRGFVIGWGTIYFGGPTSDILQEVNVRVWDPKTCRENYKKLGRNVLDTMLCAGEMSRDSCQGDSGGPLNCINPQSGRWELCGVVSWGAKCAEPEYPGVYTKVTRYLDWINNNAL